MSADVVFYIVAVLTALFTIGVVAARNMLHAAIFLVASFTSTAVLYLLLQAEFAAIMQLVVYVGGIVVVIVFIILLTSHLGETHLDVTWARRIPAWPLALAWVFVSGLMLNRLGDVWRDAPAGTESFATLEHLGRAILTANETGYILPFEIISLLLLTAVIGAMVIARRQDTPRRAHAMTLTNCLMLGWILFAIGVYGLIVRRHLIGILLCVEVMLNAANINFIAFAHFGSPNATAGVLFSLFVIAVSACELAVALAIVIVLFRQKKQLDASTLNELQG